MKRIVIICFIFLPLLGFSQSAKLKQANKEYENMRYVIAASLYSEELQLRPNNLEAKIKLANCYRKIEDTKKAELLYAEIVKNQGLEPINILYYAQVLANNKKYEESKKWYEIYENINKSDSRADNFKKSYNNLDMFYRDSGSYKLKFLSINTPQTDFSPAFYKNGIVFCSGRKEMNGVHRVYGWNLSAYLDLYYLDDTTKLRYDYQGKSDSLMNIAKANQKNKKVYDHDDETETTSNDSKTVGSYGGNFNINDTVKNWGYDLTPVVKLKGKINSKYHEGPVTFFKSQDTIIFTRNNFYQGKFGKSTDGTNRLKLYSAVLKDDYWTDIKQLPFDNDNYSVGHPSLSPDNKKLYFVSDMPGGIGGTDLYSVSYANGQWGDPVNIGRPVNTEGNEMFPFIDDKGDLFLSSDGHGGLGGLDIFSVKFKNGFFDVPTNLGYPVNSDKDDFGYVSNLENSHGYFSSNRKRGLGDDDIYEFWHFNFNYTLEGLVGLIDTKKPLDSVRVVLFENNIPVDTMYTNIEGTFDHKLQPNSDYQIVTTKPGFITEKKDFTTKGLKPGVVKVDILERQPEYSLFGLVDEAATHKPLDSAQVVLYENGKMLDILYSAADGKFDYELKPNTDYEVITLKKGYIAEKKQFTTKGKEPGIINLVIDEKALDYSLHGLVDNVETKDPLRDARIIVFEKGIPIDTILTNSEGTFDYKLNPNSEYDLLSTKQGFKDEKMHISTVGKSPGIMNIVIDEKPAEYKLIGSITSSVPEEQGVKKEVILYENGIPVDTLIASKEGKFDYKLKPDTDYDVFTVKDGTITEMKQVSTKGKDPGIINVEMSEKPLDYTLMGSLGANKINEPANSRVVLFENGIAIDTMVASQDGKFDHKLKPNTNYELITLRDGKVAERQSLSTVGKPPGLIYTTIEEKPTEYILAGIVDVVQSHDPIENASVIIFENGVAVDTVFTNKEGKFDYELKPETDYELMTIKQGYVTEKKQISTKGVPPGLINLGIAEHPADMISLIGTVINIDKDETPIEGVRLQIVTDGAVKNIVYTRKDGTFGPIAVDPEKEYVVYSYKDSLVDQETQVSTKGKLKGTVVAKIIYMNNRMMFALTGTVTDRLTEEPIENEKVYLKNVTTGRITETNADLMATFFFHLDPETEYEVYAQMNGNRSNVEHISTKNKTHSEIMVAFLHMTDMNSCDSLKKMYYVENLYYDVNKINIRQEGIKTMQKLINILNEEPKLNLVITSHADNKYSALYSETLSKKRAEGAQDYLVANGIPKDRISYQGFGDNAPSIECKGNDCPEKVKQQNRRTEFYIIKDGINITTMRCKTERNEFILRGIVDLIDTHDPISEAKVVLYENGIAIDTMTSSTDGKFVHALKPNTDYELITIKQGYVAEKKVISTKGKEPGVINVEIEKKSLGYTLAGVVDVIQSHEPIDKATVIMYENGVAVDTMITGTDGKFNHALKPNTDYELITMKQGYVTEKKRVSTKGLEPGVINVEIEEHAINIISLVGTVMDIDKNEAPIENVRINVVADGVVKHTVFTRKDGTFGPLAIEADKEYVIYSYKDSLVDQETQANTKGMVKGTVVAKIIYMNSKLAFAITGTVADRLTDEPIESARVYLRNLDNNRVIEADVDMMATFHFSLEPGYDYEVFAQVKGNKSNLDQFSTKNKTHSEIMLSFLYLGQLNSCDSLKRKYYVENLYYDVNKVNIRQEGIKTMQKLIDMLKADESLNVVITSHADNKYSALYSETLSKKRAEGANDYLIANGISRDRMSYQGFGNNAPSVECKTADCPEKVKQQNRRTEFYIIREGVNVTTMRCKTEKAEYMLAGIVDMIGTHAPVRDAKVILYENGVAVDTMTSNTEGAFSHKLKPNTNYELVSIKEGLIAERKQISTIGREPGLINLEIEERLQSEQIMLIGSVTQMDDKENPLADVSIDVTTTGKKVVNVKTRADGTFGPVPVEKDKVYALFAAKDGMVGQQVQVNTTKVKSGTVLARVIYLNSSLNFSVSGTLSDNLSDSPIEKGVVYLKDLATGKVSETRPDEYSTFYFDLKPNKEYELYAKVAGNTSNVQKVITKFKNNSEVFLSFLYIGKMNTCDSIRQKYYVGNVYYDLNKADLRADAKPIMQRILQMLKTDPSLKLEIESHADSRGSDGFNLNLSRKRVVGVKEYLIANGIDANRLKTNFHGERLPDVECLGEAGCLEHVLQKNRRTEFNFTQGGQSLTKVNCKDVSLEYTVIGKARREFTQKPFENVTITLTNLTDNTTLTTRSNATGDYSFSKLKANSNYVIKATTENKCGFSEEQFSTKGQKVSRTYNVDFEFFCDGDVIQVNNVYYELGKSNITAESAQTLNELVQTLKKYSHMTIELRSHTDARATNEYNQRLSQARANSAAA